MNKLVSNCSRPAKMQKAYPKQVRSQNGIFYYKTGLKMSFLSKMWAQNLTRAIYMHAISRSPFLTPHRPDMTLISLGIPNLYVCLLFFGSPRLLGTFLLLVQGIVGLLGVTFLSKACLACHYRNRTECGRSVQEGWQQLWLGGVSGEARKGGGEEGSLWTDIYTYTYHWEL